MHTTIVLFCLAVAVAKVSANPLLQAIQSQTCPICQQNSLKNQLASSLPILLNSASNLQLYPPGIIAQNPLPIQGIVQPANPNTLSCPACVTQSAQNQCNQFCPCQPQTTQPSPCQRSQTQNNQINSAMFNKILSNPMIKSILDPNARLFNQNGLEAQRNTQCNNGVPNVINNYIIVPPEFLTDDGKCRLKEDQKVPEERRNKNKQTQGRRRRPKTEKPTENRRSNETDAEGLPKHRRTRVRDGSEKDSETGKRGRRRKSRRRQSKNKNAEVNAQPLNETVTNESEQLDTTQLDRPEKMNETVNNEIFTTEANIKEQSTITASNTGESITAELDVGEVENKIEPKDNAVGIVTEKEIENISSHENKTSEFNATETSHTSLTKMHVQNSKEVSTNKPKKMQNTNSTKNQVNSPRNAREEAVINDFKRKFPNIPEDVVRKLLDHMKRHLVNQGLGFPPSYYPQFPMNFDQLYDYPFNYVINTKDTDTNNQNKPKRRKNKRKQNRRRKNKIKNADTPYSTTGPITDKVEIETTTVAPTTTEEPIIETTTIPTTKTFAETEKEVNTIETTTVKNTEETKAIENIDTDDIKDSYVPDLGSEDEVPIMFVNGLIDEYYPDFTGDHQYFSDEDFSFIRLEDDIYHYTTDKNFEMEELNRERRRYESHADDYKRPEGRFILRLRKNKNRDRIKPKINVQEKRLNTGSRLGTTIKPKFFENITERPQIRVTVINEEYLRPREDIIPDKTKSTEESAETKITQEIEAIQFRTPPVLEKVDFETKQINKNFYDLDFKTSSYSEAKTPQYVNEKSKKHKALDEIETVYARSKVVTYGKPITEEIAEPDDEQETEGEKEIVNYLDGNDGTSFVIAQSIPGGYW